MSADRLEKAKTRLNAYYEAELAVLSSQQYQIDGRMLRRADLKEIREAITQLEGQVQLIEGQARGRTGIRSRQIVFRDN
ncbi:DUF6148 family protein [Brevibacillus porteri]|uniref:DUF6148 family protein n=1 Tax=Brevibacillus porteri TaxID=2126350 RepID=UPI003D20B3EB